MSKASVRKQKTKTAKSQSNDTRNTKNESQAVEQYAALVQWVLNRMKIKPCSDFSMDDAYNAGAMGVVVALRTFDPSRTTFITYASACIRIHTLNARRTAVRGSLHQADSARAAWPHTEKNAGPAAIAEANDDAASFIALLPQLLTFREREVLNARYGIGTGESLRLADIGRKFRVTSERIRQIESNALTKLRAFIADTRITITPK